MIYKTRILLTNTRGITHRIRAFSGVRLTESETDPVKTATVEAQFIENEHILAHHGINSTIEIYNRKEGETVESLLFTGYLSSVPKVLEGNTKRYSFQAEDVVGKTKNILINEVFDNQTPRQVVEYLIKNYTDFFNSYTLNLPNDRISLEFRDEYLYDCLNKIAEITGTYFEAINKVFVMKTRNDSVNTKTIKRNMFERGSAQFNDDSTQMVNHIRLYGGKELTPNERTDVFNPSGTMKQFYTTYPASEAKVYLDGALMRLGTMYLHDDNNRYDAYIDYNNNLIEFVNPPPRGQEIRITYRYYQRIVVEETDQQSIEKYGYFMRTERVEHIIDRATIRQLAKEKIRINNAPKKVGSLKVFRNDWKAKEKVKVEVPELGIMETMTVTQKDIAIEPNRMDITLSFERKPDLSSILKNHLNRIRELEKGKEEVESIDKYRTVEEKIEMVENITINSIDRDATFKIGVSLIGEAL